MFRLYLISAAMIGALATGVTIFGQTTEQSSAIDRTDPDITPTRVSGEVRSIDATGHKLLLTTNSGNMITVIVDEKTTYVRVPPGETTLDKATTISFTDVIVGDRIIVRGRIVEDRKSIPARQIIVMTKSDLQQREQRNREDWRKRGVTGRIIGLNTETKEITLGFRERESTMTIRTNEKVIFQRFPPDSVKFSDARPSSLSELKVGDQVRARGEKSVDGSSLMAEEIISGSFRMVGGSIQTISAETGQIKINNIDTNQPLTILIKKESVVRRVPSDVVRMIEARTSQKDPKTSATATTPNVSGSDGGSGDIQEIIERLPPIQVSDLKPGELIVVSSTIGRDPSLVTAITVAAGLEDLVRRAQKPKGVKSRITSSTELGLPTGVMDGGIGVP